jgi:ferrochelatase
MARRFEPIGYNGVMNLANTNYDALLIVAFGGPEGPDDVMPFLENVTRGRNIPRERLEVVAEHYHHFGGKSPINDQVRALISDLRAELDRLDIYIPIYWGNRNWHPMLPETLQTMADAGVKHALAVVLASYSSYSSCRQYRENIEAARQSVGEHAPTVDKLRVFYNHPDFVAANADRLRAALQRLSSLAPPHPNPLPQGERGPAVASDVRVAFTAHSIPLSMAQSCDYVKQLRETSRLTADSVGIPLEHWELVYQSRSGRPQDPWLEPDILDHLRHLHEEGVRNVIVHPVGFLSDHMEVLFDLDFEARAKADELGMSMVRANTVGTHPRFVSMLAEMVVERMTQANERRAIGCYAANHDVCHADCCPAPIRLR